MRRALALLAIITVWVRAEPAASKQPALANLTDNSWLKLNPDRQPRSRMYCGCCMGDGRRYHHR